MRRERQRIPAERHEQHRSPVVETARRGTRSAGEPMRDNIRLPLESQFGHDFRNVRIHCDGEAQSAAQELAARAYTTGRDVVFAEGSYAPETSEGARVLAHELTHVVQQSEWTTSADIEPGRIIDARDPSELAAERVTETITRGRCRLHERHRHTRRFGRGSERRGRRPALGLGRRVGRRDGRRFDRR